MKESRPDVGSSQKIKDGLVKTYSDKRKTFKFLNVPYAVCINIFSFNS
jgi:hypothetical protein